MDNSYWLILGFALLMFILLLVIAAVRMTAIYRKQHGFYFKSDGTDVSPLAHRICRAHANCYENLPIVTAVVLVAAMTNNLSITNPLALYFLGFRVAQSLIHVISISSNAIILRFLCFLVQAGILLYWFIRLITVSVA